MHLKGILNNQTRTIIFFRYIYSNLIRQNFNMNSNKQRQKLLHNNHYLIKHNKTHFSLSIAVVNPFRFVYRYQSGFVFLKWFSWSRVRTELDMDQHHLQICHWNKYVKTVFFLLLFFFISRYRNENITITKIGWISA